MVFDWESGKFLPSKGRLKTLTLFIVQTLIYVVYTSRLRIICWEFEHCRSFGGYYPHQATSHKQCTAAFPESSDHFAQCISNYRSFPLRPTATQSLIRFPGTKNKITWSNLVFDSNNPVNCGASAAGCLAGYDKYQGLTDDDVCFPLTRLSS